MGIFEVDISEQESQSTSEIKITVVGVGGGGCNTMTHIMTHGVRKDIKIIAMNTDAKHLGEVKAHSKIQLGEKITGGLGAGMKPEIGKKSAEESYEAIKREIEGSHIVFVASGLGGGTGTGAAPVVVRAAKEIGALVIAVVTTPFAYEMRDKVANEGLREVKKEADTIIVIPNERLIHIVDKKLGIRDMLKIVDNVLAQAITGTALTILNDSGGGYNVDYADLRTIMEFKGLGLIGLGDKDGEDSAMEAIKEALESPLLDNISIKGARGAIVHIEVHDSYPGVKVTEAFTLIQQQIDKDAFSKFCWSYNSDLNPSQVRVTLIITGFEREAIQKDEIEEIPQEVTIQPNKLRRVVGDSVLATRNMRDMDLDTPTWIRHGMD